MPLRRCRAASHSGVNIGADGTYSGTYRQDTGTAAAQAPPVTTQLNNFEGSEESKLPERCAHVWPHGD
jgi:hypothetical protein